MVQILIEQAENSTELILIELQGALDYAAEKQSLSGERVGFLFFTQNDMPVCVIGQHILDGKMVELDKPLLVMRKRQADGTNNTKNVINIFSVELIIDIQILFILSSSFNTLYKIVHNGTRRCEYVLLSFIETTFIMVIQLRYFAAWDTYYMASLAMN
ncbi:unnamed protein product [Rotaria magnacalcarata]